MPSRKVLDVGNCGPDHASIRRMFESHFDVDLHQTHGPSDTLSALRTGGFDLVLVNRKLDQDYSDGLEIIKLIKADADLESIPVMLITNYPEHQEQAIAEGAIHGFGKLELQDTATLERLRGVLA